MRTLIRTLGIRLLAVASVSATAGWSPMAVATWGMLDPSFGNAGIAFADFTAQGSNTGNAYAMAIDAAGHTFLAGRAYPTTGATSFDFAVAKFDVNGIPDAGFGSNGRVVMDLGMMSADTAYSITIDSVGAIYVGGSGKTPSNGQDMVVVKLTGNGQLANGFGSGGIVRIPIVGGGGTATGFAFDASGNTYVGGGVYFDATSTWQCAIAKLDSQGALVSAFGNAGIRLVDIGGSTICRALAIDAAGNLYLGGDGYVDGSYAFAAMKFDPAGNLFPGFGSGGKAILHGAALSDDYGNALALDAAGNVYLAGASNAVGSKDFAVVKWDSIGVPVASFGTGGRKFIDLTTGSTDSAQAISIDAVGHLLIAGIRRITIGNQKDVGVVALDANGTLLSDFGICGIATFAEAAEAYGIAADPAGRITVGGWGTFNGMFGVMALRLLPGSPECIYSNGFETP